MKLEAGEDGASKGFGFINFGTHEEAAAAVEAMDQFKCGVYTEGEQKDEDRLIFVGPAMKKAAREKVIHDKFVKLKRERMQQFQGLNLYVKNLDDSVDDERLKVEFSVFGTITSARIMRDEAGTSRGFGFICFSDGAEATKAVTDMSGKMLAGKPIYVALAQRKEVRQAQLNAAHAARTGMARGPMGMPGMMFMPGMMGGARPMMMQPGMMPGNPMGGGGYPRPMMGMPGMMNPQQQQRMMMNGGRPNGGRNNNQRGGKQQGKGQFYMGGQQQQQQQQRPMPGQPMMMPAQPQQMPPAQQVRPMAAPAPLTAQALASAPPAKQKNMIGERLYPLIQAQQPQRAGKITGMLLEMDNGELLNLLESPDALKAKVNEAVQVLEQHSRN